MLWFGAGLVVVLLACLVAGLVSDARAVRRGSGLRDARTIDTGVYEVNKIVGAARCGRFRDEDSRPRRPTSQPALRHQRPRDTA